MQQQAHQGDENLGYPLKGGPANVTSRLAIAKSGSEIKCFTSSKTGSLNYMFLFFVVSRLYLTIMSHYISHKNQT